MGEERRAAPSYARQGNFRTFLNGEAVAGDLEAIEVPEGDEGKIFRAEEFAGDFVDLIDRDSGEIRERFFDRDLAAVDHLALGQGTGTAR